MTIPNAFVGRTDHPTAEELDITLGDSACAWHELVNSLAEAGVPDHEWKCSSPKYGWSLVLTVKKRRVVYLSPCNGCFLASFALGDRAVAAARQSDLPKRVLKIIDEAPHYAEGTGVRLLVEGLKDLPAIRKLALIKLAN
jgi:hypothetical protein